jgi:hypothetical protein
VAQRYQPPKQSGIGQAFDAIFLMAIVFFALWFPVNYLHAGAAKGDWLPGTVTVETAADGSTVVSNDRGLVKRTAADGTITYENLTWEALDQNAVMQAQWGKLGIDLETAAGQITLRYDYSVNILGVIATLLAVAAYFGFLVFQSDKEYRQVVAEKFGKAA